MKVLYRSLLSTASLFLSSGQGEIFFIHPKPPLFYHHPLSGLTMRTSIRKEDFRCFTWLFRQGSALIAERSKNDLTKFIAANVNTKFLIVFRNYFKKRNKKARFAERAVEGVTNFGIDSVLYHLPKIKSLEVFDK